MFAGDVDDNSNEERLIRVNGRRNHLLQNDVKKNLRKNYVLASFHQNPTKGSSEGM